MVADLWLLVLCPYLSWFLVQVNETIERLFGEIRGFGKTQGEVNAVHHVVH